MKKKQPRKVLDTPLSLEEMVNRRKDEMVAERQKELEEIMDRHDDLVREQFHLEKFVTLIYYNPQEAKNDVSEVFLQYKAERDLTLLVTDATATQSRARKTRSAVNDRMIELVSPMKSLNARSEPKEKGSKAKDTSSTIPAKRARRSSPPPSPLESKRQGPTRTRLSPLKPIKPAKGNGAGSAVNGRSSVMSSEISDEPHLTLPPAKRRKLSHTPLPQKTLRSRVPSTSTSRLRSALPTPSPSHSKPKAAPSSAQLRQLKPKGKGKQKAVTPSSVDSSEDEEEEEQDQFENLPPLPEGFPRKLRVYQRPKPIPVTNPDQRPLQHLLPARPTLRQKAGPKPKPSAPTPLAAEIIPAIPQSNSISLKIGPVTPRYLFTPKSVLNSYTALEFTVPDAAAPVASAIDKDHVSLDVLERQAYEEAVLREKIATLQQEGRLPQTLSSFTQFGSSTSSKAALTKPFKEPSPANAFRKELLTEMTTASAEFGSERKSIIRRISKAVQAYFAGARSIEEKKQKEEVKRIRLLSKNISKLVEAEWKKAIWHTKQKILEIEKEEEAKRGKIALDQVLEQSGVILGVQRGGMEIARVGGEDGSDREADSAEDDESGEDKGDEDEDEEGEEEQEEEEEEEGEGEGEVQVDDIDHESETRLDGEEESEGGEASASARGARSKAETGSDTASRSQDAVESEHREREDEVDGGSKPAPTLSGEHDILPPELPADDVESLATHASEMSRGDSLPESRSRSKGHSMPMDIGDSDDDLYINQRGNSPSADSSDAVGMHHTRGSSPISLLATSFIKSVGATEDGSATKPFDISRAKDSAHSKHTASGLINGVSDCLDATDPGGIVAESPRFDGDEAYVNGMLLDESMASGSQDGTDGDRFAGGQAKVADPDDADDHDQVRTTRKCSEPARGHSVIDSPQLATEDLPTVDSGSCHGDVIHSHPQDDFQETSTPPVPPDDTHPQNDDTSKPTEDQTAETDGYQDLPAHLRMYAAAVVDYDSSAKVVAPPLLRGSLRPYQQTGMEWLATLHKNELNGILADEMGLGKTIQTIALLAHLACDQGIWGPHLIVVPTSVILNWDMEFKKFLPGFRVLSYHGSTKRRKELRVGWNNRHAFNVVVTSYTLASRDAHIFKRKPWYYFILDEAHMIKNFKSQRWNILLTFRSHRRLLLTGTPLQNNLTELWSLLKFLMSGTDFVDLKEFGEWFSSESVKLLMASLSQWQADPLEKAIENSSILDQETRERVDKLHTVLRPYLLRRLKADVEKELPNKYEHVVMCRLSKRQRYLYDEFMQRAHTRAALSSGVYQKVANILMQLRKVCNHPDLFEIRPIVTSFAMERPVLSDFEREETLVRRRIFSTDALASCLNFSSLGLRLDIGEHTSQFSSQALLELEATNLMPLLDDRDIDIPAIDVRSIDGYRQRRAYERHIDLIARQKQARYLNGLRCRQRPIYGIELLHIVNSLSCTMFPFSATNYGTPSHLDIPTILPRLVCSLVERAEQLRDILKHFAVITPTVVASGMERYALPGCEAAIQDHLSRYPEFDSILHPSAVRLQIAFPDSGLLQYDSGKLQELAELLRQRKAGGHRVLIFTQMTKILDILEIFLNFHGWLYLRLDGATKIEDRQYVTERFNADPRVFAFIASSRSGGVGVNLTGADTVVFFDSDFNPQMDRQCEDRAHRIGQIRDVHIYRFISQHTVEEAIFRKANQKRSLDDIVIQKGEFDWRNILSDDTRDEEVGLNPVLSKALGDFEEVEDARAAQIAAREEDIAIGEDKADFEEPTYRPQVRGLDGPSLPITPSQVSARSHSLPVITESNDGKLDGILDPAVDDQGQDDEDDEDEDGSIADYMLKFVKRDWEFFCSWKI